MNLCVFICFKIAEESDLTELQYQLLGIKN